MSEASDVQGWFHHEEGLWYAEQARHRPQGWIIEVGCWKGRSTSYLREVLRGRPQRLWCVDDWRGSDDHWRDDYRRLLAEAEHAGRPVREQFRANLEALGIPYKLLEEDSSAAARHFEDRSCALILLDASHDGESVARDLRSWWPKVCEGGILAGHDYQEQFPDLIRTVHELVAELDRPLLRGPHSIYHFRR